MNLSKFLLVMGALFASFAFAEVYKWVDEEGITQYGDCPPPDCVFEELELPKGPSDQEIEAAKEKMRNTLEARKARDAEAKEKRESETLEEQHQEQLRAERLSKCSEAIYQLELLNQQRRVFKLQADESRLYLDNEDRPGEISRITALKDQFCGTDPSVQKKQIELAHKLSLALSRKCAASRETLERMLQPDANPNESTVEEYQLYVEAFCPAIDSGDLWLGDWIIVRKQR